MIFGQRHQLLTSITKKRISIVEVFQLNLHSRMTTNSLLILEEERRRVLSFILSASLFIAQVRLIQIKTKKGMKTKFSIQQLCDEVKIVPIFHTAELELPGKQLKKHCTVHLWH